MSEAFFCHRTSHQLLWQLVHVVNVAICLLWILFIALNDSPSDKARLVAVRSELGSARLRAISSTACGSMLPLEKQLYLPLKTAGLLSESNQWPDGYTLALSQAEPDSLLTASIWLYLKRCIVLID
ncbi:hypothetical protein HELRODRAFT_182624 [Helobdella robusta]|uniref:Uncharacterized protein n=1 Tax=Helobdella robusta TaxID=6412 RepID=T1FIH7_HELRO|nr:hypothetical protein HELRODRAFT_182624 [Helobdella robusta]ESN90793.1 hypothetical protein HELRODRAFT_182624 [Helobdella robusta]